MTSAAFRTICRFLVLTMALLPFQAVHASMIGAGQMAAPSAAQSERAAVLGVISRADVASELQALGVDPKVARDRVRSMTNEEVHSLAGKIDSVPAGGMAGFWTGVLVVAILAALVWAYWR